MSSPSPFEVISFDGTPVGPGSDFEAWFDARDTIEERASVAVAQRRNNRPTFEAITFDGVTRVVRVTRPADSSVDLDEWRELAEALFTVSTAANTTPRDLVYYDGAAALERRISGFITNRRWVTEGLADLYIVTFFSVSGTEANDVETSLANPATVTNLGNIAVSPIITLTTTTHVTHRACTVVDESGLGLIGHPIMFALSDTDATTANTLVFVEGVSVPTYVADSGGAASRVWALVDAAEDGTATNVDILYGTGLVNPLGGTLDAAGMDFDDADMDNEEWHWNAWAVLRYPARSGAWRPARMGNHVADVSHAIVSAGASGATISVGNPGQYDDSGADALVMDCGIPVDATSALRGMTRTTSGLDGTNARAYVRYRTQGSTVWLDAWTTTSNAAATGDIDLDGAVQIAVGLENHGGTADPSSLVVTNAALGMDLFFDTSETPTVVVGAAADYDHYDGTLTIGDYVLTFHDLLVPDGTLTIDCVEKDIESSVAGMTYWIGDTPIEWSDPDVWAALEPGDNAIANTLSGESVTISHRAGWS